MSQARTRVGRVIGLGGAALLMAAGAMALAAPSATAATSATRYVATNGSDSGANSCMVKAKPCKTIQHAVNAATPGDSVSIGAGTFKENVGVDKALTITGSTTGTTTVIGKDDPAFAFVSQGSAPEITLAHVSASRSTGDSQLGLGIGIDGPAVTITDSTISGNAGGGIDLRSGKLTLSNSAVDHNQAFGIIQESGTLNISHSTVSDTEAAAHAEDLLGYGVGLIETDGATRVVDSSVSGNALLGIYLEPQLNGGHGDQTVSLSVLRSSVSDNDFVGIANDQGTLKVADSTVTGNGGAGVLTLSKSSTITESTITDTKPYTGGAVDVDPSQEGALVGGPAPGQQTHAQAKSAGAGLFSGRASLTADPDWAAAGRTTDGASSRILADPAPSDTTSPPPPAGSAVAVSGTIVASKSSLPDCTVPVKDGGYNLSSDKDNSCDFTSAKHSLAKTDAKLGALAANGGPTQTMQPDADSPVIDAIPVGDAGCVSGATDQRGIARPQGARCDIGAVEVQGIMISPDSLPAATQGKPYKAVLTATGGADSKYLWSLAAGSALPTGLTLTKGGVLSGTPAKAGTFTFTVSVNDPVLKKYTLRIAAAAAPHSPAASGSGSQLAATGANAQPLTQWGVGLLLGGLLLLSAGWIKRSRGRHVA